ncbi:sulfur carrier protein ThiS [Paracoccus aminophilus]|uniref:Thiamine biosynthesis protein ThiS n=1 Tax=Paracoccus aminophilus JCM 7686 TaxID=1367847 RepID=S5Y7B4_PARAH|nr:sulfur carrier protein ThiS [Paracoccus aminophilus]AGT07223.1 thiamine biosynthesis protein ThiS [Paracoccus aminophilus JCM 7686]
MNIILNGTRRAVSGPTVADVLAEIGLGEVKVATALNGEFLPAGLRATTAISDGDALEALSSMQGG